MHELIESALVPVIQERLAGAKTREDKEKALLGIRVCDVASGSGHFLLAAARRLGKELATVRTGEASPAPEAYREAVRDVIRTCIYAVDKNPLASDLCKVALWIEGHHSGLPLSFLDHHVKTGDSLVGVFDLNVLKEGIPDEAYAPVTGDDKAVAANLKKLNKAAQAKNKERYQQRTLGATDPDATVNALAGLAGELREFATIPETTPGDVRAKEELYEGLHRPGGEWDRLRRVCNLWTAAFFLPMDASIQRTLEPLFPTTSTINVALSGGPIHGELTGVVEAAASRLGFFHWPLEFPEVFQDGGFDVILANPPWEQVQPEEQKFFASRDRDIADEEGAKRKALIESLPHRKPDLFQDWSIYVADIEKTSKFLRTSKRYPLTSYGKVNLYSTFAELIATSIGAKGRGGIILPIGIATDDSNKHFFGAIVGQSRLASLQGFENEELIFPAVHHATKFCLLGISGTADPVEVSKLVFYARQAENVHDDWRIFHLSAEDFSLLNPNTLTCPVFRSGQDAAVTTRIYKTTPVFVRQGPPKIDPWGLAFRQGLFNLTSDSGLFRKQVEFDLSRFGLGEDNRFLDRTSGSTWLALYEGKMIFQYDHRFGTYLGQTQAQKNQGKLPELSEQEHQDPFCLPLPQYWVMDSEIESSVGSPRESHRGWFIGFRDITSSTSTRTAHFAIVPWVAIGHSLPLIGTDQSAHLECALLGNLNSFVFDYVTRQKLGGTHLTLFVLKQLPVLPPERYTPALLDEIVPRAVELVYTAHDMERFARDCGYDGPPYVWNEERRAQLRAELDGIYAHLYGLSRDDFAYILDQFPIVQRNDRKAHGEFRTKRLCLEMYDARSPEAKRSLEDDVKAIEVALRALIVQTLEQQSDELPAEIRARMIAEQQKQLGKRATPAYAASMPALLESALLIDLQKIIVAAEMWPRFRPTFESKGKLESNFYHLNALRNALFHNRSLDDASRAKGEQAIQWFKDTLEQQ